MLQDNGWIPLHTMIKFPKLKRLLINSDPSLLTVCSDNKQRERGDASNKPTDSSTNDTVDSRLISLLSEMFQKHQLHLQNNPNNPNNSNSTNSNNKVFSLKLHEDHQKISRVVKYVPIVLSTEEEAKNGGKKKNKNKKQKTDEEVCLSVSLFSQNVCVYVYVYVCMYAYVLFLRSPDISPRITLIILIKMTLIILTY